MTEQANNKSVPALVSDISEGITTITDAFDALPLPVKTSFFSAAGRMLGGLAAFPAAWFRRPVQSFEDVTDARSIVSRGLAQAVLDRAKTDPAIL